MSENRYKFISKLVGTILILCLSVISYFMINVFNDVKKLTNESIPEMDKRISKTYDAIAILSNATITDEKLKSIMAHLLRQLASDIDKNYNEVQSHLESISLTGENIELLSNSIDIINQNNKKTINAINELSTEFENFRTVSTFPQIIQAVESGNLKIEDPKRFQMKVDAFKKDATTWGLDVPISSVYDFLEKTPELKEESSGFQKTPSPEPQSRLQPTPMPMPKRFPDIEFRDKTIIKPEFTPPVTDSVPSTLLDQRLEEQSESSREGDTLLPLR